MNKEGIEPNTSCDPDMIQHIAGRLSEIKKLIDGRKGEQTDELLVEYLQGLLDIWAEMTKDISRDLEMILSEDAIWLVVHYLRPMYIRFGDNRIYEKGSEVDLKKLSLDTLEEIIKKFFEAIFEDLDVKLKNVKREQEDILNLLKGITLTYEIKKVKEKGKQRDERNFSKLRI